MKQWIVSLLSISGMLLCLPIYAGDWQNVPLHDCQRINTVVVWGSVSPDRGGISPTVLVDAGTKVNLTGAVEKIATDPTCKIITTILPFRWSLSSQSDAGPVADVSAEVLNPTTSNASFIASKPGLYIARLASQFSVPGAAPKYVHILVVPGGESWIPIGPQGVALSASDNTAVGRVNSLLKLPDGRFFAGSGQGGIHEYFGALFGWRTISDGAGLPAEEVTSLASGAGEPTAAIYAATGEEGKDRNGYQESNFGIARLEGGAWQVLTAPSSCPPGQTALTARVLRLRSRLVRPALFGSPAQWEIIAAANNGLFRSVDGGACWTVILQNVGTIWDVDYAPSDSSAVIAIAAQGGVVRISGYASATPSVGNLFSPFSTKPVTVGRLAIGKTVAYAVLASPDTNSAKILVATDGGSYWTVHNAPCSRQCDWYPALTVDPRDDSVLYYGEVSPWVSTNGATSFTSLGLPTQIHADEHDLLIDSATNSIYAATDGGIYQLRLQAPGLPASGAAWTAINEGLQTNQIAQLSMVAANLNQAAMGSWDNGTQRRVDGVRWSSYNGGDGQAAAIGDLAASVYFAHANAGIGSDINRSSDKLTVATSAGFESNPYNSDELFVFGESRIDSTHLLASIDASTAQLPTWHCVDPDPQSTSGPFQLAFSKDGFFALTRFDGSVTRFTIGDVAAAPTSCASGMSAAKTIEVASTPPSGAGPSVVAFAASPDRILAVTPSHPTVASRVQVLARQNDGTWKVQDLAGTLMPAIAATLTGAIGEVPEEPSSLYVGSQRGAYKAVVASDGTASWSYSQGSPDAWVTDIQSVSGVVRMATYGRGVWEHRDWHLPCAACSIIARCLVCGLHASQGGMAMQGASIHVPLGMSPEFTRASQVAIAPKTSSGISSQVAARLDEDTDGINVQLLLVPSKHGAIAERITSLQMRSVQRGVSGTRSIPVDVVVRMPKTYLVTTQSILHTTLDVQVPVKLHIVSSLPYVDLGSGQLAVRSGTRLTVSAPRSFGEARLSAMMAGQFAKRASESNQISVVVSRDIDLSAIYEGGEVER